MRESEGRLIWITGLAGSGKTTLAEKVYEGLKEGSAAVVHLDGDRLREVLGVENSAFSPEERKKLALQYARFASLLTSQGIDVVMSTISLFHDVHDFNKANNQRYIEVLIETDQEILKQRNKKQLYQPDAKQVMGVHYMPQLPKNPTLRLQNNSLDQIYLNTHKILEIIGN